jgi:hypothetical protein
MKISFLPAGGASLRPLAAGAGISMILVSAGNAATVTNPNFSSGTGGSISNVLTLVGTTSAAPAQQLGTTGWYGLSNATNLNIGPPIPALAGFRAGVESNSISNPGVGRLNYGIGLGVLGGLVGLELPEADLWQPLTGQTLLANTTYQLSMDVDAGSILNVGALGNRGFGIGISSLSTTTGTGTMLFDSLTSPSLLNISLLSGNNQRLVLQFTTGGSAVVDPGIVVFGGRGTQAISASLLNDYVVDNVTLAAVPEPSVTLLFGGAAWVLLARRRR